MQLATTRQWGLSAQDSFHAAMKHFDLVFINKWVTHMLEEASEPEQVTALFPNADLDRRYTFWSMDVKKLTSNFVSYFCEYLITAKKLSGSGNKEPLSYNTVSPAIASICADVECGEGI
jgi:hypothetical protein